MLLPGSPAKTVSGVGAVTPIRARVRTAGSDEMTEWTAFWNLSLPHALFLDVGQRQGAAQTRTANR
jgi:hypothetical protein